MVGTIRRLKVSNMIWWIWWIQYGLLRWVTDIHIIRLLKASCSTRNEVCGFLMLYWSILSSPAQTREEGELKTKRSLQGTLLPHDPGNTLASCTEEEAFDFLYSLYGSNRNSDVTDEEIDQILKFYLPNKSISR